MSFSKMIFFIGYCMHVIVYTYDPKNASQARNTTNERLQHL